MINKPALPVIPEWFYWESRALGLLPHEVEKRQSLDFRLRGNDDEEAMKVVGVA